MKVKQLMDILKKFNEESFIYFNINNSDFNEDFEINYSEEKTKHVYESDETSDSWSEVILFINTFDK